MGNFNNLIIPLILLFLVVLVVFALAFTIISAVAFGLGTLLMRIVPLSLFEATLLSVVFAIPAIFLLINLGGAIVPDSIAQRLGDDLIDDEEDDDESDEYLQIPRARFYASDPQRTWEAWLRAEIANDIYMGFQDEPQAVANLNKSQQVELAIRLSDVALSILKRKKGGRGRLRVSMAMLKQQLSRMGQRSYDDDIMRLALSAVNMNLEFYAPVLSGVIRAQGWDELATPPKK